MHIQQKIDFLYNQLLSERTKKRGENTILTVAILSYLIHLSIIYLVRFDFIGIHTSSELLKNPIAAIYTPFSFILIYEVYLLIYYLPKSITTYIGKQYEIITLIIIRRLFKDLSNLSLSNDWFKINYDLQFTYDLIASLLLFFLIYLFLKQQQAEGKIIFPPTPQIFSAFDYTPFNDPRVVIIGQDPYHGVGQAHGLCFSVNKGVKVPPSLKNIYKEIKTDIEGFNIPAHGDLSHWAKQGVLLLNATLTVEKDKAEKAIALSLNKYCSVAATLRAAGCTIDWTVTIN
jgi:hypothetical protein